MTHSLLFAYAAILTLASGCVYLGSYASLHTPISTRKLRLAAGLNPNEDENEDEVQSLNAKNAWTFPVMGSVVLFSLFLAFKYLDKQLINVLIAAYFAIAALFTLPSALSYAWTVLCDHGFPKREMQEYLKVCFDCQWVKKSKEGEEEKPLIDVKADKIALILFFACAAITAAYLYTKQWVAADFLALCFALQGIVLITLDSFATGFILLGGLFFYDIFWVFGSTHLVGTSVMVDVATKFDAPIKILVPKNAGEVLGALLNGNERPAFAFALLGLGDIVIPGVFVALALRFDQMHAADAAPSLAFTRYHYKFAKPYFTACFSAYILGLFVTMAVMHIFHAAQPALLYLSPACAFSVLLVALARGEVRALCHFTDKSVEAFSETQKKAA